MFLAYFRKRDWAEDLWLRVFALESLVNSMLCFVPEGTKEHPPAKLRAAIETYLLATFPPAFLTITGKPVGAGFVQCFLDGEYDAIVGRLRCRPDQHKRIEDWASSAWMSAAEAIAAHIEMSQSFREGYSQFLDTVISGDYDDKLRDLAPELDAPEEWLVIPPRS